MKRWGYLISAEPVLPGVWKKQTGGHLVRLRVMNPKTGRKTEILRSLDDDSALRCQAWLTSEKTRIRHGLDQPIAMKRFVSFAASVFESKIRDGSIESAAGRKKWARVLEHLCHAPWADYWLDRITHADLVAWRRDISTQSWKRFVPKRNGKQALGATGKKYAPTTLNDWLAIARVIFKRAKHEMELPINPIDGIEDFPLSRHRTYTKEQPNSLTPEEVPAWLAKFREYYPQFYALVFTGFVLGQRKCTLFPLLRTGATPDIDLTKHTLIFRRSNTIGQEVMQSTKTGVSRDEEIVMPPELTAVLKWHIDTQLTTWQMRKSELLFPTLDGGLRAKSCLDKPFAAVTKACGLTKTITPRAMRRTFQDMARAAQITDIVQMAIANHTTDGMRKRYSTANDAEITRGIAQVISIATGRRVA